MGCENAYFLSSVHMFIVAKKKGAHKFLRGGSTYHNMKKKKKTITHGSGNAYFLRPEALHLFMGDVQPCVHS